VNSLDLGKISTEKAIFSFTEEILGALVSGLICDLTEAFDCVNHELLMSKLNSYGIQNVPGQCFKSYLSDKKQQVEINTPDSDNSIYSD
jgi:hypothetical protein